MTKNLPSITTKQQEILKLLYKYRFLDRKQIQALLGHKDKRRVISWLQDLREKECVAWQYDATDFAAKTKPAIYYLSLNGIRYLRDLDKYPGEELRKRYKESTRQQSFIDRCLLIADCCITLRVKGVGGVKYEYRTESDYADPDDKYNFLIELKPHLLSIKQHRDETTNYLLHIIDPMLPRYMIRKRLKDYVEFLAYGEWERETDDDEPPIILLTCPTVADLIYAKRRIRKLLEDEGIEGDESIKIRLATVDKVRARGVTSSIWEEV
jgi:hypothetical protein